MSELNKENIIILPCEYDIKKIVEPYDKFGITKQFLKNIEQNSLFIDLITDIYSINKHIVYAIKKKNDKYRFEFYLISKDIYNGEEEKDKFKVIIIEIMEIFKKYAFFNFDYKNIFNILEKHNSNLLSFDLDFFYPYFNNKLHIYSHNKIEDDYFDLEYDLKTNKEHIESTYNKYYSYDEIDKKPLNKILNDKYTKIYNSLDVDLLISKLKKIYNKPKYIMLHHKFNNKTLGIMLLRANYSVLQNLIEEFHYNINIDNINEKLIFDIGLNYDPINNKIVSTGFYDFF